MPEQITVHTKKNVLYSVVIFIIISELICEGEMRYCKGIFKLTLKYDYYSRVSESWLTGLVQPDTIFKLANAIELPGGLH
jgi:hypothetical protein